MAKPRIINFKEGGVLIYNKRRKMKCTAAHIGFMVGSYHNGKDKGTAHFLEHMLFNGTESLSKDEFRNKVSFIVPGLNAGTSNTSTTAFFVRANDVLEQVFELVSDMLINTNLTEENMKSEIGVIQEELRRKEIFDEENITAQAKKSYGRNKSIYAVDCYDCLGTYEGLKNFKLKTLQAFKKRHYNLNNFISVVTTSIPLYKIKKLLRKHFLSKLKLNRDYQKTHILFDANRRENLTIALTKKNKLSIELGFKLDKKMEETENDFNYRVLSNWIGERTITSFLTKRLRDEGLIYSAKTSIDKCNNELFFKINIDTGKDKLEKVIECINWAINIARMEKISFEKLKEIKDNLIYEKYESNKPYPQKRNEQLLRNYCRFGEIKKSLTTRQLKKHLKSITPDTIYSLANEVFSMKTPLYITLLGNIEEKDFPSHKELKKMILKDKD